MQRPGAQDMLGSHVLPIALPHPYGIGRPSDVSADPYQQQLLYEHRLQWQQQQMGIYDAAQLQGLAQAAQPQLQLQAAAQPPETDQQRLRRQQRVLLMQQRQRRQAPVSPPLPVPSAVSDQLTGVPAAPWPGVIGQAVPPRPPSSPGPRGLATVSFSLPRAATPASADEQAPGIGRLVSRSAPALWMRDPGLTSALVGDCHPIPTWRGVATRHP